MPLCIGDDWLQKITCHQKILPIRVHLPWDKTFIHFEKLEEATEFGVWLQESEARAQEGYRTMRG